MPSLKVLLILLPLFLTWEDRPLPRWPKKIFDVHLHDAGDPEKQFTRLKEAGVYQVAFSTSWDLQNSLRSIDEITILFGLMFPCPNGKVPYSTKSCFSQNEEWPDLNWVEQQIKAGKIDFFGEVLSQYYGISSSDPALYPYYELAQKYRLPLGIHTGGAGPNHGSPNFKIEMGSPLLLKPALDRFPKLKIWMMHAGDHYYRETIQMMKEYPDLYTDLSVVSDPSIVSADRFSELMREFIDAGLEDRLMFGTDNGDIEKIVSSIENLDFLSEKQKEKIYYLNAEHFFSEN